MASNITLNEQTGTVGAVVRTMEMTAAGVTAHVQIVQMGFGSSASFTQVQAASPMPVDVHAVSATVATVFTGSSILGSVSATVQVAHAGGVAISGTANVIFGGNTVLGSVSATVNVKLADKIAISGTAITRGIVDSISATVLVAHAGGIAISGTAAVVLTGSSVLGSISATVNTVDANLLATISDSAVAVQMGPRGRSAHRYAVVSTATGVLITASAALFHDITYIHITNLASSVNTVTLELSGTGQIIDQFRLAASGGGAIAALSYPIPTDDVNKDIVAVCSTGSAAIAITVISRTG